MIPFGAVLRRFFGGVPGYYISLPYDQVERYRRLRTLPQVNGNELRKGSCI